MDESVGPSFLCRLGIPSALFANRSLAMTGIPAPKTFTIAKVLSATPTTSGVAVTDTENFFNKNCPMNVEVVRVQGVMRSITSADFNGSGAAVGLVTQVSQEVDTSPSPPTTPTWDTLVSSVDCKAITDDGLCFDAPGDGTNVLDQTYVAIPKGGSMRCTLSAQVENAYSGDGSEVEILVLAEFRPTDVKDRRYF